MAEEEHGEPRKAACGVLQHRPQVLEVVGESVHVAPEAFAPPVAAQVEDVAGETMLREEREDVSVAPRVLPEAVDQEDQGPGLRGRRRAPIQLQAVAGAHEPFAGRHETEAKA